MRLQGEAQLARIFVGEEDRWHGRPLYQQIVKRAKIDGMAGATVFRGCEGFGSRAHLHTARILRLSESLPMVIEIVDQPDRIQHLLGELEDMVGDAVVTLERVEVVCYRSHVDSHSPLEATSSAELA